MGVDDGLAPVQFLIDGVISRIAQPHIAIAGEQNDAVRIKLIHPVFDLGQAAVDIGKRHVDEHNKAARIVRS